MIRSRALIVFSAVLSTLLFGCRPEEPETTISRETFKDAYVALRLAGLQAEDQEMTVGLRDHILDSLGLAEEDLLQFVDIHGSDVQFMRGVWEEVDSVLSALRRPEPLREGSGPS